MKYLLRHGCSPVNLLLIFRTPFYKNTSGWQLLKSSASGYLLLSFCLFFDQFQHGVAYKSVAYRGQQHRGGGGAMGCGSPLFCVAKRKKGNKEERKSIKAETIKRLSPKSKCHCFSHCRVSRIQNFFLSANHGDRQYFSVFHGPSTLKSISAGPGL